MTNETASGKPETDQPEIEAETAEAVEATSDAGSKPRPDEAEDATVIEDDGPPEQATESLDVESIVEATADKIEEALAEEASAIATSVESVKDSVADAAEGRLMDEKDALAAAFGATAGAAASTGAAAAAGSAGSVAGSDAGRSGATSGGGSGGRPPFDEDDGGFIGGPERPGGGQTGSGWLIPFAAAVLGALLGGGGAYLALKDSTPNASALAARFVEQSALDARIVAVETAAAEQVTEVSKIYDGRASEIDDRVANLAKELRTVSAEAGSALNSVEKQAAQVSEQKAALEAQAAELTAFRESVSASITEMSEKLAVLDAPREAYAEDVAELRGLVANLATLVTANGAPGAGSGEGATEDKVAASGDPLGKALATRMALLESRMEDLIEKFDAPSEAEVALGEHVDAVDKRVAELETVSETVQTTIADQKVEMTALANGVAATGEETAKWRADIEQAIELTGSEILRHDEWIIQADEHFMQIDTRLENALDRYGELDGKIGTLDEGVAGRLTEALAEPVAKLGALGEAGAAQGEKLASIEDRVASLEQTSQAFVKGEAAVGVAFAALSQAVAGADPYDAQVETLEKVAEVEVPEPLKARAASGLPSKISLATRFVDASRKALAASHRAAAEAEDAGIVDSVLNRVSSIIVVRRIDEAEGDSPGAVLSRVGARIDEGDVAAALTELAALPQAGRDAMAGWIVEAEARAGAEKALAELRARLLGVEAGAAPEKPAAGNDG